MLSLLAAVLAVFGALYFIVTARARRSRVLAAFALIAPATFAGVRGLTVGTDAWRKAHPSCATLVSPTELQRLTGVGFTASAAGFEGATACEATVAAEQDSEKLHVAVSAQPALSPDAAARALDHDGLDVSILNAGEWALLGQADAEEAAQPDLRPLDLDGLDDAALGKARRAKAVIWKCGVALELTADGEKTAPRLEELAQSLAPSLEGLCKLASPWPAGAPWVKRATYSGPTLSPDDGNAPYSREAKTWRHGEDLLRAGAFADAVPELESVLAMRQARLGEQAGELAPVLRELGVARRQMGRLEKGEAALRRAVTLSQKDARERAAALDALATTVAATGRVDESIALYEKALAAHDVLGTTADAIDRLAILSREAEQFGVSGAHNLQLSAARTVLAGYREQDPAGPRTLDAMNSLARAYGEAGEPQGAIPVLTEALALRQAQSGDDSLELVPTLEALSSAELLTGEANEAKRVAEQALDVFTANNEAPHGTTTYNLGAAADELGRSEEAVAWLDRSLEYWDSLDARGSRDTVNTLIRRSVALTKLKRELESRSDQERAVALMDRLFGHDSELRTKDLEWLASDLDRAGAHARAREVRALMKPSRTASR
jgi:tetratricopeptide (TPR) repeat protein